MSLSLRHFLFGAILLFAERTSAQSDTLRICTYNLLNYGNSANTYPYKNTRLSPILQEIKASLTCFNEVSTAQPGMLDTLIRQMPFPSAHGRVHNTVSTTQLDGLFWRLGKFRMLHDSIICSDVRDIVAYDLYYDYSDLATYLDTVKLTVITAHLKSSNASADKADRAGETAKVSAYLASLNKAANYIMLGDFNLYTSSETAYQNLTNPTNPNARLNDPLNRPGSWDNNASFGDIHTQSPRLAALPDGGASGGLDSRFDFVLVSDAVLGGAKGIKYLPGSYKALGNDGQHYGRALTDMPANSMVSASIAQALYECSDHLPVFADFAFTPLHLISPAGIAGGTENLQLSLAVVNPFASIINLLATPEIGPATLTYQLLSIDGKLLQSGIITLPDNRIHVEPDLSPGLYFLRISNASGDAANYRLVHY